MLPLLVAVVILFDCTSKSPPSCGVVSSTTLSIALGLAVELEAIPSNLVPSAATSRPSTVPDTDMLPVTEVPVLVTSTFVLPPVFIFRFPVPVSSITESVPLWNISNPSELVPYTDFTLSLCMLCPENVLPVVDAKLPLAVTPPCQVPPL